MNSQFPNTIWNYKNFNMVNELNIAGEFIFDGIDAINRMSTLDETPLLFSFLYHVSVGIERIQKIILVLFELDEGDDYQAFENSLISHSHVDLNRRIKAQCPFFESTQRENSFLSVLTRFYSSARYSRFNIATQNSMESMLLSDFLLAYLSNEKVERHFFTNQIIINAEIKELLGRVVGSLAKKYYSAVKKGCTKAGTFSYELQPGSKAERVFYTTEPKNSLYKEKLNERIALKELIVYFRNTSETNSFIRFIESIEPLRIDPGMVNEYISDLCKGIIPQSLIDEVDSLYEELSIKERLEIIDGLGNTSADFDWIDVNHCYLLLRELTAGGCGCKDFIEKILPIIRRIKDDDVYFEIVEKMPEYCQKLLDGTISEAEFLQQMNDIYQSLDRFYQ